MEKDLTEKDIADAQKVAILLTKLNEDDKTKVMVYASALRDKEIADKKASVTN